MGQDIVEDTGFQSRMDQIAENMAIIKKKWKDDLTDSELRIVVWKMVCCLEFVARTVKEHLRTGER